MDAVEAAFAAVPRAGFLPRGSRLRTGYDGPISIGHGQTSSQPRTVAAMLRLLEVRAGDRGLDVGVLGVPEAAPYDRILVSAQAAELPRALVDQLGTGGRIVVPVNGTMTLAVRRGDDLVTSEHGSYRFVPLL